MIKNCRICDGSLFNLVTYENMPKAAQNLPDQEHIRNGSDAGVDIEVCQCKECGLIQLSNEPVDYYKEVIRASAFSEEMREFRIKQFEEFIQNHSLMNKTIIEIGTGKGEYLSLMKRFNIDAYGLEYSEQSVNQCNDNGLNVLQGYIDDENYKISNKLYDAFFILNFFEHMPDPNTVLKGLANNLSEDAVGIVEVPTETLKNALSQNGFEIIECKEIWYDYILSAIVRKRKKTDLSSFREHKQNIESMLNDYISSYDKVAVWGAGHQALTVLSLANLGNKIQYVVDDASFKQNKYTPATHIPILPSQVLKEQPVDAVIIMAASYSDEVARKIRQNFDKSIDVSILRDYGLETV